MSVSLSQSLSQSFTNKFAKTVPAPADDTAQSKATKVHPLLNAKTEAYVDDTDLYKPRISRQQRYNYYHKFLELNGHRRRSKTHLDVPELEHYPTIFVYLFAFIRTNRWDQWYLNFFLLWLILVIVFTDGWVNQLAPIVNTYNTNNNLLQIPLAIMLVTQIIPFFGSLFFVHFCNDLMHLIASKNFQQWVSFYRFQSFFDVGIYDLYFLHFFFLVQWNLQAFASCLVSQYVEYFYYGGRNRRDKAGKVHKSAHSFVSDHHIKSMIVKMMKSLKPCLWLYGYGSIPII